MVLREVRAGSITDQRWCRCWAWTCAWYEVANRIDLSGRRGGSHSDMPGVRRPGHSAWKRVSDDWSLSKVGLDEGVSQEGRSGGLQVRPVRDDTG